MDPSSTLYIGYANCASHFSRNIALTTWAIYTALHTLVLLNYLCIGSATNNQAEYDVVIGLLIDTLDHRILHLHVHLDSLMLVMQLNGVHHLRNQVLLIKYLWVKLLVREFETITLSHVPRAKNSYVDTIVNNILVWHLSHIYHRRRP